MTQAKSVTPEILRVAEELLSQNGADLSTGGETLEAAQKVFRRFYEHLRPRIGDGGFRSMLQLAHRRAMATHPALESFIVQSDSNPFLGETTPVPESDPVSDVSQGLVRVLAESLCLMEELAQDQDWDLVELWPGLKALEDHDVSLLPDARSDDDPGT